MTLNLSGLADQSKDKVDDNRDGFKRMKQRGIDSRFWLMLFSRSHILWKLSHIMWYCYMAYSRTFIGLSGFRIKNRTYHQRVTAFFPFTEDYSTYTGTKLSLLDVYSLEGIEISKK